jgi:Mg/Co/Ni transporter MgtE
MTTADQRTRPDGAGSRMEEAGEQVTGAHDETRWSLLTTEFWAMLILAGVLLIAAAASDSFDDNRAWTLVTIVGAAYIVSRGLAKSGTGHTPFLRRGRRV